jgi:hypothetical protein
MRLSSVRAAVRVSVQLWSAGGAQTLGPFDQEVADSCLEDVGMRDDDDTKFGILGVVSDAVSNFNTARGRSHCPLSTDEGYRNTLTQNLQQMIQPALAVPLRNMPNTYLERARHAADRETALENYVMFILSTSGQGGEQSQEALKFINSVDPDLKSDAMLP